MRILIPVLAISFVLASASCGNDEVFGQSPEAVSARLSASDYEFLRHIDYEGLRVSDVDRLGAGAGYYLSRIYLSLGLEDPAVRLAEHEFEKGDGVWDLRSGRWLASRYLETEDYPGAHEVTDRLRSRFPTDERSVRLYGESLYRLERDEALLAHVAEHYGGGATDESPEAMLWWLVARMRLETPGWEEDFVSFFRTVESSAEHARLALYIGFRPDLVSRFSVDERRLFRGQRLLADGDFPGAYEDLLAYLQDGAALTESLASDFLRAALGSGNLLTGADFLASLAQTAAEPAQAAAEPAQAAAEPAQTAAEPAQTAALLNAGRLYRWAGAPTAASEVLRSAVESAPEAAFQRTLWYYLSSLVRSDPIMAATEVALWSRRFEDPGYFADLLEELVAALAERQEWDTLWLLREALRDNVSAGTAAHLNVLVARLIAAGLLDVAESRRESVIEDLLSGAARQSESLFYRLLAEVALGGEPAILTASNYAGEGTVSPDQGADTGTDHSRQTAAPQTAAPQTAAYDAFVLGHFDYGLYEEGYVEARARADMLSVEALVEVGDLLSSRGMVEQGLRIHTLVARRQLGLPSTDLARRLYPLGYQATVRQAASTEGLPEAVLFALIREESYFDPEAISHAGAIGLVQMMPTTAEDMAGRLRLEEPELTDAVTSIRLGSYYLSGLAARFVPISRALAAYNAGQGRVRQWEDDRASLDSLVFMESIPYAETRGYIRKVLVSAVYYGYLYENRPPSATIRGFFPELQHIDGDT